MKVRGEEGRALVHLRALLRRLALLALETAQGPVWVRMLVA